MARTAGPEAIDYIVKEEGSKRYLVFDVSKRFFGGSIVDDPVIRANVLTALGDVEADLVVLADVYERVYDEEQTSILKEIANLRVKFNIESIWSYNHLGLQGKSCERFFSERHDALVRIAHDLIVSDPLLAYFELLGRIKAESAKIKISGEEYAQCAKPFMETLSYLKNNFESTVLIRKTREYLEKLAEIPETPQLYRAVFEAELKPSFIGSRLLFRGMETLELLDEYQVGKTTIQVFRHPEKTEALYFINPPEYTLPPEKYFIMSKTKEVVAGYQPGKASLTALAKSRKYFERVYESTIKDVARANGITLENEEITELAEIVARYTVGYGILEILLQDRKLTDIYLDSPIGQKPLYIVHSDFGECQTNIIYTTQEASAMVSKLRAMSGRPFDEAHPVLDFDLPDLDTRVAAIGPPLATDGIAFAFRLHKITPWTLPQFINVDYLNPLTAGLLSFFVDVQATTLVTGSRGSGKTSLLGALILEIPQNIRIIVQEDTQEIVVPYMKEIGFNIQRLKTRSPISVSKTETEVAPEESLRTALRLGDSALVLGEVRSREAKVLYEAMRIGAAGNIVMGTIHGDSAYSVWDRVVNDLGVPNTSFKATDVVVVARPIRFAGSLKRNRRVVQVTEVKKHWLTDPQQEAGLLDLMLYDARKDSIELLEDNLKESDLFERISRTSGLTIKEIWQDIRMRGSSKDYLVEQSRKFELPELLEAENTVLGNNKLLLLKEAQIEENGSIDYDDALGRWKNWVNESLLKKLLSKKKKGK